MQIDKDSVLITCAVRYAMGRLTYMPGMVVDEIMPMLPEISDRNLTVMGKDLAEYLMAETHDADLWNKLYKAIIKEQIRRINNKNE